MVLAVARNGSIDAFAPRTLSNSLLFLRKNVVVSLRRLGAAADVYRILRLEAKVGSKFNEQLFAALDGDNGTAGFDANIRVAGVIFFQSAGRYFDHTELGIDGDGFFPEQPPGEQLP